jgi:hypothetical protein
MKATTTSVEVGSLIKYGKNQSKLTFQANQVKNIKTD